MKEQMKHIQNWHLHINSLQKPANQSFEGNEKGFGVRQTKIVPLSASFFVFTAVYRAFVYSFLLSLDR